MIRSAIANSAIFGSFLAIATCSGSALAEPSGADAALAEALFTEGRKLFAAGRFAEACPKLAESQRLDPGGGTLLNLAICHEAEGKTATAWAELKEALGVARRDGRLDRERLAEEHLAAVEPRLSRLTVRVGAGAELPGLEVSRDGAPLAKAAWGLAVPLDPGPHVIAATADGGRSWKTTVILADRAESRVVDVPAWDSPPPASSGLPATSVAAAPSAQRTVGYVVGGAGIASVLVGAYFGVAAVHTRKQSNDVCRTLVCDPSQSSAVTLNDEARRDAVAANVTIGLGLIATGLGAYLVVSSPSSPASAWVPSIAPQRAGAKVTWSAAW